MSHSIHFTQRCLYILTWTPPQPASHAGALSPPLTLEQLKVDLRLWLQMLSQHVPNARIVLVGTRDDGSDDYQSVRQRVEVAVDAEIEQLNRHVGPECRKLQQMLQACESGVFVAKNRWRTSEVGPQFDGSRVSGSEGYEKEMDWWLQQSRDADSEEWQQRIATEVFKGMQRAKMLQQRISLMAEGKAQLQRVASFTVDCLSGAGVDVMQGQLSSFCCCPFFGLFHREGQDRSSNLDYVSGRGVAELKAQLGGLCSRHVPRMGETLPRWWQMLCGNGKVLTRCRKQMPFSAFVTQCLRCLRMKSTLTPA
jgi:hypothetical protein